MNDYLVQRFTERLDSFLGSECDDYGISVEILREGTEPYRAHVVLRRNEYSIDLEFRYRPIQYDFLDDGYHDDIELCLYEDHYEAVREYDWTVRYFWMKVSPYLFPVKE